MSDGYLIGPNLKSTLHDMVRDYRGHSGGGGPPTRIPTTFGEGPAEYRPLRIATFGTAAWSINSDATVTLTNVGVTGYTVVATNIFGTLPSTGATQSVAVAKDGTAWYMIAPAGAGSTPMIRMGTFNSPWSKGDTKTITLLTAGGTLAASNTLIDYPAAPAGKSSVNCVIANDGGTWYLANWEMVTATAAIVASVNTVSVVTDVSLSATLNTSSCAITIGKTNTTARITTVGTSYTTTIASLT